MKIVPLILVVTMTAVGSACVDEEKPIEIDPYHCWNDIQHRWEDCDWSAEVKDWAVRNNVKRYKVLKRDGSYQEVWTNAKQRKDH